jgi:hypothetical protein
MLVFEFFEFTKETSMIPKVLYFYQVFLCGEFKVFELKNHLLCSNSKKKNFFFDFEISIGLAFLYQNIQKEFWLCDLK